MIIIALAALTVVGHGCRADDGASTSGEQASEGSAGSGAAGKALGSATKKLKMTRNQLRVARERVRHLELRVTSRRRKLSAATASDPAMTASLAEAERALNSAIERRDKLVPQVARAEARVRALGGAVP